MHFEKLSQNSRLTAVMMRLFKDGSYAITSSLDTSRLNKKSAIFNDMNNVYKISKCVNYKRGPYQVPVNPKE